MAGRSVFLYGTLRDPALLGVVLGRPVAPGALIGAVLHGHAARRVVGGDFPVIVAEVGAAAEGCVAAGMSDAEIARLEFYESAAHYELRAFEVETPDGSCRAEAFWPLPGWAETGPLWDFAAWRATDGGIAAEAALEVMSELGQRPSGEVAERHPQMRARAQSRMAARAGAAPMRLRSGLAAGDVTVRARRRPYSSFFSVEEFDLDIARFGGGRLHQASRAALVAVDAVTVLPYDAHRDRVLLVEQLRVGPLARGDATPWTLEPVAGRRDPGESVAETAMREAREEAGLALDGLEHIASFYPSPGCLSEYIIAYLGLCALPDGIAGTHGLAVEGEDIRTHLISFAALMEAVESGEAATGPLILSALWLARNRDRLRGDAGA